MKYRITIGERDFVLDVDETNGNRQLAVDAQPIEADVAEVTPDRKFSLLIGGRSYTASVERSGDGFSVAIAGQVYELSVVDERTRALTQLAPGHGADGELIVKAPMPGLVLNVQVDVGQVVEKNTHLIVLEAMKMENDISSPRSGKVKDVRVHPGDKVNKGDVLVVIG